LRQYAPYWHPHRGVFAIFFQNGGIRHLGFVVDVWTTHDEYLLVLITVQNAVGIDAVVLI